MRRAVFLDRDGTLIRNHHYGCDPDTMELLEGVVDGLKRLKAAGFLLVVVTNQSGVARGFFTEAQLAEMHRRLVETLVGEEAPVDAIYYCPHHPEGVVARYAVACDCRKPSSGMLLAAAAEHGIDLRSSWFVGDILDDVEAGKRVGCRAVLMDLGTEGEPESPTRTPDYVARGFVDAAEFILSQDAPEARGTQRASGGLGGARKIDGPREDPPRPAEAPRGPTRSMGDQIARQAAEGADHG